MKSFRNQTTGVLKAFGCIDANAPGDLVRDEPDDFALEPGKWRLDGDAWVPYTPDTFDADVLAIGQEFIGRRDTILNVLTGMAGRAQRAGKTDLALAMDALAALLIPLDSHSLVTAAIAARDKTAVRTAFKNAARLCAAQTLNQLPPDDQLLVVTEVAKVFK